METEYELKWLGSVKKVGENLLTKDFLIILYIGDKYYEESDNYIEMKFREYHNVMSVSTQINVSSDMENMLREQGVYDKLCFNVSDKVELDKDSMIEDYYSL